MEAIAQNPRIQITLSFTNNNMIRIPPYLKKGDTIGLICPSGYMPTGKVENCVNTLGEWGFQVRIGNTVGGSSTTYFSGTEPFLLNSWTSQ